MPWLHIKVHVQGWWGDAAKVVLIELHGAVLVPILASNCTLILCSSDHSRCTLCLLFCMHLSVSVLLNPLSCPNIINVIAFIDNGKAFDLLDILH